VLLLSAHNPSVLFVSPAAARSESLMAESPLEDVFFAQRRRNAYSYQV
jgi:hypothetical protein